ncbi:MAG: acetoacetate--CoA ligase [Arenicella sp.]
MPTNKNKLWANSHIEQTQLFDFQTIISKKENVEFDHYRDLHQWSIKNPATFWKHVAQFCKIKFSQPSEIVMHPAQQFHQTQWFVGATVNYAENLLQRRDQHIAIVSCLENKHKTTLSYAELYSQVSKIAQHLKSLGVSKGDRVAGIVPNTSEAIIAMLATTSLGAIWSSCSPDFGVNAALDRFSQIEPSVLIGVDGYLYGGKVINCQEKLSQLNASLKPLQTISIPLLARQGLIESTHSNQNWDDLLSQYDYQDIAFEQLPFDHPLFIVYSSGTTGKPKCIVHSVGGTLIQHRKEHALHTDLSDQDVFFYFTTCGWMMWNWLVTGLASGATLVLFDGNPLKETHTLLDLIDQEKISVFGTSAKYLDALQKNGSIPRKSHQLSSLRSILSTGSPLVSERFDYVYQNIKHDILLSSISGGTDIVSCFILGNPTLPVYRGQLQCAGLGMDVQIFDDDGKQIEAGKGIQGELVCCTPFPCCPIGFWNDHDNSKFMDAYFNRFEGVWAHGDFAEQTAEGGYIIHGRSDTVLNPGGVRIGTAEIYRQVEKVEVVEESLVVGQHWDDDVRVVLFVALKQGTELTDTLITEIRQTVRTNTTPRHMPSKVLQVSAIPKTRSGKITEKLVNQLVNKRITELTSDNTDALQNPEVLSEYMNRTELEA